MGASVSSNTAKSIAKVSNNVSNSTNVSANQVNAVQQAINFDSCYLNMSGDINIQSASSMVAKSKQIVTALQQSHIQNDIAQRMMQQAKSQVGFLGVGYASANNYASQMADATSSVVNQLTTVANQFNYLDQNFQCTGSTFIGKNFLLSQGSDANFFSEQVVKNQQISDIANSISQTISQKATATVSGLSAFLLIFVLIIAAVGYALTKPLSSGSGKMIVGSIIVVLIAVMCAVGFLMEWPPLFSPPNECTLSEMSFLPSFNKSGQSCNGTPNCINPTQKTIRTRVPLPFKFPIWDKKAAPIQDGELVGSLAGMAASRNSQENSSTNNQGLNAANAHSLNQAWETYKTSTADIKPDPTINTTIGQFLEKIGSLSPMWVPTDGGGNLYNIPPPFLPPTQGGDKTCNGPGSCCYGDCSSLSFSLTGIINPPTIQNKQGTELPQAVYCEPSCLNITPGSNNSKKVVPVSGNTLGYICPTDTQGKIVRKSGNAVGCGCYCGTDSPSYKRNLTSSKYVTAANWNSTNDPKVNEATRSALLAETRQQADMKDILNTPAPWESPDPKAAAEGWLARYVRTFYYEQLDLLSPVYFTPTDLVYVADKDGNRGWCTAKQAIDNGVACYLISTNSTSLLSLSINGISGSGSRVDTSGMFGICNDQTYKFSQFSSKIGIYIAIGLIGIALLFVLLDHGIHTSHGANLANPSEVLAGDDGAE